MSEQRFPLTLWLWRTSASIALIVMIFRELSRLCGCGTGLL